MAPQHHPEGPPLTPNLIGPDEAGKDWRDAKILESLLHIQREALRNGQATGEVLNKVALLEKDMAHLVETFGARVTSIERRVDGIEQRQTQFESRGDARLTAVSADVDSRFRGVEERLHKMDLTDANRVGMVAGGRAVWAAIIAVGGSALVAFGWLVAHVPFLSAGPGK